MYLSFLVPHLLAILSRCTFLRSPRKFMGTLLAVFASLIYHVVSTSSAACSLSTILIAVCSCHSVFSTVYSYFLAGLSAVHYSIHPSQLSYFWSLVYISRCGLLYHKSRTGLVINHLSLL